MIDGKNIFIIFEAVYSAGRVIKQTLRRTTLIRIE
jgi:hypothetical protein